MSPGLLELQSDSAGEGGYQNQEQQLLLDASECFTNPCQNGGLCIPKDTGLFECKCARGFEGALVRKGFLTRLYNI